MLRLCVHKELLSFRAISLNAWALQFVNESKVLVIVKILGTHGEIVAQKRCSELHQPSLKLRGKFRLALATAAY